MSGLLRPADVFVDVGANWGYFSLAAAHWVGPRGRVVAFEPEPRLYRMLVTNIAANDIAWIETHPIAIAAGDGRMSFAAFREDAGNWGIREPWFTPARAISSARRAASTPHSTRRASAACGSSRSTSKAVKSECLPGCRRGWLPPGTDYVLLECHPALLAERGESAHGCVEVLLTAGYRVWMVAHSPKRIARGCQCRSTSTP